MSNSDRPIGAALLLFLLSGFIAMVLLTTALVAWLSELIGSIGLASVIVGGFFSVIAAVVYFVALRDFVATLSRQIDTIYEVSSIIQRIYRKAVEIIEKIVG